MRGTERLISNIENAKIGLWLWLSTFLCVIFIRDFLETAVVGHRLASINFFHFVHVPVFFFFVILSVIIWLHVFSKEDILKVSNVAVVFSPIILTPILIDLLITLNSGSGLTYLYATGNLRSGLINFFNPFIVIRNISCGIRAEITAITILSVYYIYLKRKNILSSLLGGFFVFISCFLSCALPVILLRSFKLLSRLIPILKADVLNLSLMFSSGIFGEEYLVSFELIIIVLLCAFWFSRYDRKKFEALVANFRFIRSFHYFLLLFVGIAFYLYANNFNSLGVPEGFSLIKLFAIFFALFFAGQFSIVTNDIVDFECDKISNSDRPLVKGVFSKSEYLNLGVIFLIFSLLFAAASGSGSFIAIIQFICLYFIYSMPPLKLKRFFLMSSLIIGLQAVLAFFLGFILFQDTPTRFNMPPEIAWLIFIIFSLSASVKDLKDIEGDRASGVFTLPVILGEASARRVIGALVCVSYLIVPFFLIRSFNFASVYLLVFVTYIFGALNYFYILKRYAKEKIIFCLYYICVFSVLLLIR